MIVSPSKRWFVLVAVFVAAPVLALLIRRRARACRRSEAPRVLILPQLTRIGDLVCATPVFRAIKERYPGSFVAVVVTKMVADILAGNPYLDEVIIYRQHALWGLVRTIRERRFCWSFSLSGSLFATLVAFLGFIPRRAATVYEGRTFLERLTDRLNTDRVRYSHHTYLPRHYLDMLALIGIYDAADVRGVFIVPDAARRAEEFFADKGLQTGDVVIGMAVSAGNKVKEWGDRNFAALARLLVRRYDAKILVVGGRTDEERLDAFGEALPAGRSLIAFSLPLSVLPALLQRCHLFVSVDTGPLYVAHALGVPVVDILGPVDPAEQPPRDARSIHVKPPPHIQPSSFVFKRPGSREERQKAAASISVEAVFRAVEMVWQKIPAPNHSGSSTSPTPA